MPPADSARNRLATASPPRNPFSVSAEYAYTMRLALSLALLPGLGTGLLLVLIAGLRIPLSIQWPQLAQAHGQIQTLGFVVVFIVSVGMQLFPRFLGAPLHEPGRATWGATVITLGLIARLVGQPFTSGAIRTAVLAAAALAVPAGALLAGSTFHGLPERSIQPSRGPAAAWRSFILVGGLSLGCALLLYLVAGLALAFGDILVDQNTDEALIHLELVGFTTCLIFGVGSRIFGRFFLLRSSPRFDHWVPWLAGAWAIGLLLVSAGWFVASPTVRGLGSLLELVVAMVWLWLSGMYRKPVRESGTPYVTNPTRRWVRIAFGFLLVGLLLNVLLFARELLTGEPPSATELSAARHALAQGFVLPMMVSMAARLLPIFSADVLKHRRRLELIVDVLLLGAAIRVAAEALGGYDAVSGPLIALGGTLSVAAFALFAVGMWSSLSRLPR
jgi:NnrS protein